MLALLTFLAAASIARAEDSAWPRQFDSPSGSFVIYQPQPEQLDGDMLAGRAAFSLKKSKDDRPAFGVLWYSEQIEVDRDSSTVWARNFDVTKVRLPGITTEEASRYEALVEQQSASWDLSGSLEELQAGLAASEHERESVAGLYNAPPKILFHDRRAILVVYDGAPTLERIEGTDLERVTNTPYAVVYEPRNRSYYLSGANVWYRAVNPLGPWADISDPPRAVREVVPPDTSASDALEGPPPEVLTATEPTELIATDGPPRYAPLVGDALLYVANTESDVILEVETQSLFVLLSGRWFQSQSPDGPWTFVRGDRLPPSFKRIPPDSPKGNVLASVAGTDQAEDALADAEIPQTSAIQRGDHSFDSDYDGDPDFEPIEGTNLRYAANSDEEILLADGRYYACDQGVWYIADDPYGPWSVSETRPLGVDDIPPSCPVYDVRYVDIYDSTPDVVYVGYLPGYLGCYPSYGTVVYGTGYRYRAWRGRNHYYPHRFTWGFHARYNPWLSRWSFGFSYGSGFLRVGTHWRAAAGGHTRPRSLWFGPGGFRRPLVGKDLTFLRTRQPRLKTRLVDGVPANMYHRPENISRVDVVRVRSVVAPIARPIPMPNDVFAGKDGKVYRREPKGTWQVQTGTGWRPTRLPATPPPSPSSPPPSSQPSTQPGRSRGGPAIEHRKPVQRGRPDQITPPPPQPEPISDQPTPVQPPAVARPSQPDQPTPRPERERPTRPERPRPERERPAPPPERERPAPRPERERPAPPQEKPVPGNLEREFHARERANPKTEDSGKDRPQKDDSQKDRPQKDDSQKERPQERSREDGRPGRGR
jgi:hypothetical protein